MKAGKLLLLTFLLGWLFLACNSRELTRQKAERLIEGYPSFASASSIPIVKEGILIEKYDAGVLEGLWELSETGPRALTEKGRQFFTDTSGGLAKPANREVAEVTGITDSSVQNVKEVYFKWKFKDLPDIVERYTGQGENPHAGKALLQLFDDGWRVQEVDTEETEQVPFKWTQALMTQLEFERKARQPTQTIAKFRLGESQFVAGSGEVYFIELTDANVRLRRLNLRAGFDQWLRDGQGPVGIYAVNSDYDMGAVDLADVVGCRVEPSSMTAVYYQLFLETKGETKQLGHNSGTQPGVAVRNVCDQILRAAGAWRAKWRR